MMRSVCLIAVLDLAAAGLLPAGPLAAADAEGWGTVKGQVVFGGASLPAPEEITAINSHQDKNHCLQKGAIHREEWVVDANSKGVRWTYVWLEPEKGGAPLKVHPSLQQVKEKEVVIDQPCCRFEPHAVAIREGQDLVTKNSAPVPHSVRWTGHPLKNPGGNVIVPAKQAQIIKDLKADRFPVLIKCDIHPWMGATVRVFNHPYYALTDADGKFEIKQAPAGGYRLIVWHEATGWGPGGREGLPVAIKPDGTMDMGKLELKPQ
jgi:hypothetical protein